MFHPGIRGLWNLPLRRSEVWRAVSEQAFILLERLRNNSQYIWLWKELRFLCPVEELSYALDYFLDRRSKEDEKVIDEIFKLFHSISVKKNYCNLKQQLSRIAIHEGLYDIDDYIRGKWNMEIKEKDLQK